MKDQYFGDARDYLEYHLLEELLDSVPGPERLVCLWMLTAPDGTREGSVRFVESPELPELTSFLHRHRDSGDRRVWHMREYFESRRIAYTPWRDERPYFTRERRAAYFRGLPDDVLRHALLFFDPDNGLTAGVPSPKHLSFDELLGVHRRTDDQSLLVVYQHFQRKPRFWDAMAAELRLRVDAAVGYVAEPAVGFYVIAANRGQIPAIDGALARVAAAGRRRLVGLTRG